MVVEFPSSFGVVPVWLLFSLFCLKDWSKIYRTMCWGVIDMYFELFINIET
jgi:hypothetical protein